MSATSAVTHNLEFKRFVVRDISDQYEAPTFDLIFRDLEHGVERCSDSVWSSREQASLDRVPGSGVTEPAEGALRAKEDGHRGSWLTLSLRRPNTHQRNHDDQAHYRIDRVG